MAETTSKQDLVEVLAYDTFDSRSMTFLRGAFFATREAIHGLTGVCAESTKRLVPRQQVDDKGFTSIAARRPLPEGIAKKRS
ncbi:MAG TPA: hypothetical protein VFE23_15220 [Usitatibacter sp.]|nr:hypothetical protein [Usitatibacter sp.]